MEETDQLNRSIKKYKRRINGELTPIPEYTFQAGSSAEPHGARSPETNRTSGFWQNRSFMDTLKEKPHRPPIYTGDEEEDDAEEFAVGEIAMHASDEQPSDKVVPLMDVSSVDFKKLWKPWSKALIIKVFGRSVSLEQRIRDIFKLEWDCEIIDLESGFFLTRFYSKRDYLHVLNNGPWVILGHSLTLTKWRPHFRPSLEKVSSTLVWIHFPEVPIAFFEESALLQMGNLVGRAVKVDDTTMEVSRGRFARVCVEIDLSKKFLEFLCWAIHNWWNMKVFI